MPTIAIDGVDLFYRESGSSAPLLLIHGTGANADIWVQTFAGLAATHRVIAYDRRGYSRSASPPVKDLHRHAEDAAALLTQLQAVPATVLGASVGGIIALDLAANHPEQVSSLVLCEPPLHLSRHPDLSVLKETLKVQLSRWRKREREANESVLRFALAYRSGGSAFDRLPETLRQAMLDNTSASLGEMDAGTGEYLSTGRIGSIRCPVTCLEGTLSPRFYHAASLRLAKALPQTQLKTVAGAGHLMFFDQPGAFVEAVSGVAAGSAFPS
jgi:pimeloyl-ACP methyl ester carboxylesterase